MILALSLQHAGFFALQHLFAPIAVALIALRLARRHYERRDRARKEEQGRAMQTLLGQELIANYVRLSSFSVPGGNPDYISPEELVYLHGLRAYLREIGRLPQEQVKALYDSYGACERLRSAAVELHARWIRIAANVKEPDSYFRKRERDLLELASDYVKPALCSVEKALRALPGGAALLDDYRAKREARERASGEHSTKGQPKPLAQQGEADGSSVP